MPACCLIDTGRYGTDYWGRAAVSFIGLGANLREDAVYYAHWNLRGSYSLRLRPPPPCRAFWSVTLVDEEGFLSHNAWDIHAVSSVRALSSAAVTSLSTVPGTHGITPKDATAQEMEMGDVRVLISGSPPDEPWLREANWLPTPSDGSSYKLMLRVYWPEAAVLDGSWVAPALERAF